VQSCRARSNRAEGYPGYAEWRAVIRRVVEGAGSEGYSARGDAVPSEDTGRGAVAHFVLQHRVEDGKIAGDCIGEDAPRQRGADVVQQLVGKGQVRLLHGDVVGTWINHQVENELIADVDGSTVGRTARFRRQEVERARACAWGRCGGGDGSGRWDGRNGRGFSNRSDHVDNVIYE
jgi:hypothetical protein